MTIIIYKDDCLFADRASTRRNFVSDNGTKLVCNGNIAWGQAGVAHSSAMIAASSLEQLAEAAMSQKHLRGKDEILAYEKGSGQVWYGHITCDLAKQPVSFDWTLAQDGASIGAYSAEWENFNLLQDEVDPITFCEMVSRLWGLDTDLCTYIELLSPEFEVTFFPSV